MGGQLNFFSPESAASELLRYVANGEQTEAKKILLLDPSLMTVRVPFTDPQGRRFSSISSWEYMLWALDTYYMGDMMFHCIPNIQRGLSKDSDEFKLVSTLLEQLTLLKEKGVSYHFKQEMITERHFKFERLREVVQTYQEHIESWSLRDCNTYWNNVIEKERKSLVTHAWQHYCDKECAGFLPTKAELNRENYTRHNEPYGELMLRVGWRAPAALIPNPPFYREFSLPNKALHFKPFVIAFGVFASHSWAHDEIKFLDTLQSERTNQLDTLQLRLQCKVNKAIQNAPQP